MKRVIVDYSKLTKDILDLLIEKYPDGYDYSDVISFKNHKDEYVDCIEVDTEDTKYLVKISSKLEESMEEHYNEVENSDEVEVPDSESLEDED